jgi:LCP family protein required for cell wall assembly
MEGPDRDPRSFHVPAGPAATPPAAAPALDPREPPGPRRRRWPWVLGALVVLSLVPLYLAASAWWTWAGVEKLELSSVTAGSANATNYLVVGTDSREGVDADVENAGVIFGSEGERTDTIAVMRVDGDDVRLLAIPRDLWVPVDGTNRRINSAFAVGGPELLIRTVQDQLGIGIDHYLEVDFAGFLSLVDALGTVSIDVPHPAFDPKSGLSLPVAGVNELDATQALAYVRSRTYTEIVDGVERRDPTADLGRVTRQQAFLAAVFRELGETRNPFTLLDALDGVAANVRVDDDLGIPTVLRLGLTIRGADPATATLPTTRFFTDGGADVLLLDAAAAAPLLAEFA